MYFFRGGLYMAEKTRYEQEKPRLTNKSQQPTEESVTQFMGNEAWERLMHFEKLLGEHYDLNREIKFPFGNEYGWGFRYCHKKSLLLYIFFEEGGFCCTISINDKGAKEVEMSMPELLQETQAAWANRYACGENGG
jgi:hypothetical protein